MTRQIYNPETRTWEEGKAAPELIAPHLRELPGDYVTKDIADEKRVHEYDDTHIVEELVEDMDKAQQDAPAPDATEELPKLSMAPTDRPYPLNQWEIDIVRVRVLSTLVNTMLAQGQSDPGYDPDLSVRHLWFPQNDINEYELRPGNPPSNRDRPKHLRNYELALDLDHWPKRIMDELERRSAIVPKAIKEQT